MEEEFPSLTTPFNPLFSMKIGSWQGGGGCGGAAHRLQNLMQYYCSRASGRGQYFLQFFYFFLDRSYHRIQEWSNMMATYFKDKHNQYPKPMTK
jgi:hypothetical protein